MDLGGREVGGVGEGSHNQNRLSLKKKSISIKKEEDSWQAYLY